MVQFQGSVSWRVQDDAGNWHTVDPFQFIDAIRNGKKKIPGLNILEALAQAGIPGKGKIALLIFKIAKEQIKSGALNLDEFTKGMEILTGILKDPTALTRIVRKAYIQGPDRNHIGGVIDDLKNYLNKQHALEIHRNPSSIRGHPKSPRTKRVSMKAPRDYRGRWNLITKVIFGPPKSISGGVLSFSIADLMQVQIQSTSKFKSVFMMEEFGTGVYADPMRPFVSPTSTPFKVPPEIAAFYGEPQATAMWWPLPFLKALAFRIFASLVKKRKIGSDWLIQAQNIHKKLYHRKVDEYREWSIKKHKEWLSKPSEEQFDPLDVAFGATRGMGHGYPGREARHLFLGREGVVKAVRLIQVRGYKRVLMVLDEQIQKAVPTFPSIYNVVFKGEPL